MACLMADQRAAHERRVQEAAEKAHEAIKAGKHSDALIAMRDL